MRRIHIAVLILSGAALAACGTNTATQDEPVEPPPTTLATTAAPATTTTTAIVATTGVESDDASTTTSTESASVGVVSGVLYYDSEDGNEVRLDVYHPRDGEDLPLVVVFHENPFIGYTKKSAAGLATMIAERGAVVFVPTYGARTGSPADILVWFREQGPCAVWTAVDMGPSFGANPEDLTLVGDTTGSFPASIATFSRPAEVASCVTESTDFEITRAIFFDQDWFFLPGDWDTVLSEDPGYFEAIQPWDDVAIPGSTSVYLAVGELSDRSFYRSMQGEAYVEAEWVRLRDPECDLAGAWASNGKLDDNQMSLTDVSSVFTDVLGDAGWDTEMVMVPGASHRLIGEKDRAFIADLVFEETSE